jgi:hypothetical protein
MQTFVVRIWVPAEAEPGHDVLRGVVEHVPSGRKLAFEDRSELLAFLATGASLRLKEEA